MAARYLLDTNICIYIQRQRPPAVLEKFRKLKSGEAVISVITWGELAYGTEVSCLRDKVLALFEESVTMLPVMPLPEAAGQTYGAIRAALEAKGERRAHRQQRSVDRRARQGGGAHRGDQQRTRIQARAGAAGAELGIKTGILHLTYPKFGEYDGLP